jgi:hypothetical protein
VSLREAGVTLIDCDHRTPAAMPIGYPYVTIPQVDDGHIDVSTARRISREDFEAWTRKALPLQHDVVLSRRTNPGVTAYVPEGLEFALGQNLVLLRSDGHTVYPPFLRWLVRGPNWWAQIEQFLNVGAVFDSLKCADIPNFRLPIPPMKDQRRISEILGALDDKIELNRRLSETLEATAQTLFMSWLLDSESDSSDQGGSLEDAVDLLREPVDPQREPDTVFQHYSLPAYDAGREAISEPGAQIRSSKLAVPRGSVLLSKLNPEIERVWLPDIRPDDRAICSTEFLVLQPRGDVGRGFVYEFLRSAPFRSMLTSLVTGTTGSHQRAKAQAILQVPMRLPGPARAAKFEQVVGPMLDRVAVARRQSRTLVELRDGLLPRLLSGKLPA